MGSFGRGYILLKLNEIIKSQILIIDYQHADELHNFLIKPLIYQPKYNPYLLLLNPIATCLLNGYNYSMVHEISCFKYGRWLTHNANLNHPKIQSTQVWVTIQKGN